MTGEQTHRLLFFFGCKFNALLLNPNPPNYPPNPFSQGSTVPSQGVIGDLDWYREAELIHGRIAMVAAVGFLGPELFGTLPGNDWTGANAYSNTNPLEAFSQVRMGGGGERGEEVARKCVCPVMKYIIYVV